MARDAGLSEPDRAPIGLGWRVAFAALVFEMALRVVLMVPGVLDPVVRSRVEGRAAELLFLRDWTYWRLRDLAAPMDRIGPFSRQDDELGWVPVPREGEVLSDETRAPRRAAAPGAVRVSLSGDSYVWGSDVEADEGIHAQLEARRPDVSVHNLGVYGYGHDQMWLRMRRRGADIAPDLAVLVGVEGDAVRSTWRWYSYARPLVRTDGTGPEPEVVGHVPGPWSLWVRALVRPRTWDLLVMTVQAFRASGPSVAAVSWEALEVRTHRLLDAWTEAARRAGATPVFVYLPTEHHLAQLEGSGLGDTVRLERDLYLRWCEDKGFPCVDGTEAFLEAARSGEAPWAEDQPHWTPAGYRAASVAIERVLVDAGLIPAEPTGSR